MSIVNMGLGLLGLLYIGAPLLIFATMKVNARPVVTAVPIETMPPEVYAYFGETAPALQQLGFELVSYFTLPGSVANVTPYTALWQNARTGQSAAATVIYTHPTNAPLKVKKYMEFSTKMADGMAVMTNNSTQLGSFKKLPAVSDSLYAGFVDDIPRLYRLHVYRESILTKAGAPRYLPAMGQELNSFSEGYEYTIRRQVGTGYFRDDAGTGVYRPTLAGAFAMTWALLPPMKQMRAAKEKARAEEQLQAAEARSNPPPANVPISHESPYRDDPALTML